MPRLPDEDPLVRREHPLASPHTPAEEEERTGHAPRVVYLGELASDPVAADLPDDAVARIFSVSGKLKCALAGTVYILAPILDPVTDSGTGGNYTLTTSFVTLTTVTLTLPEAGEWVLVLSAGFFIPIGASGYGNLEAQIQVDGADPTDGEARIGIPEPATDNVNPRGSVVALQTASGSEVVTVEVRKELTGSGSPQADRTTTRLLAFKAAGASGSSGVTDHGALTGLSDDDHPYVLKTLLAALGDIFYASADDTPAVLSGNTTATKKFLNQTGDGAVSAAPSWDAIADADLPGTIARDSELHDAATVSGTPDYITLSGQDIVRGLIVLTTDVSGILPLANGGTGASTIRRISKSYVFSYPDEDMAVGDFHSKTAIRAPASSEHGTIVLGIGYARDTVVGAGTNTILIRTSTTLTGGRTTRGTINLGTAREAASSDMAFTFTDGLYLWVACSAVGGTAPKKVVVQIDATEEVF